MNSEKLFEYSLHDAWGRPEVSIAVLREGIALFFVGNSNPHFPAPTEPDENGLPSLQLSSEAVSAVIDVLRDSRLYKISNEAIKTEIDRARHGILDGFMQHFYFYNGEQVNQLDGSNLQAYIDDPGKYPSICFLAETIDKIATILIPEGIDARCFSFGD